MTVGRYAPSPSGRMHLGNLCCCLLAWLSAKSKGGRVLLRIEDLDAARCPRRFADLLESEKLFVSDVKVQWMCLNCGMVIESTRAPAMCPVCKHDQGWFIRMEMVPFH